MSPEAALGFIWSGQHGLCEVAWDPRTRIHLPVEQALSSLRDYRLFAPMTRRFPGSTKDAVSQTGNVLWVDIDSREAPSIIEHELSSIVPSLLIDSGNKGYWAYFKLDKHIATADIEAFNRGLAQLLGADFCWNCDRLARLPGSVHPESGRTAYVVHATGTAYRPADLAFLYSPRRIEQPDTEEPSKRTFIQFPGHPRLGGSSWDYINTHPRKGEGIDRSTQEQKIFTALVGLGWTDDEVIGFADAYRLPRHREELARRGNYSWTQRSLTSARSYIERSNEASDPSQLDKESLTSPMCKQGFTYQHVDRRTVLRHVDGRTTGEIVAELEVELGCTSRTILNVLKQLEDGGLIVREAKGRRRFLRRTERGERHVQSRLRRALPLQTIRGLQSKTESVRLY